MLTLFRQAILTLLILLQLFAPLVHAHVDEIAENSPGLHLPGFEQLSVTPPAPKFQAMCYSNPTSELFVSINTGVTHEQPTPAAQHDPVAYLTDSCPALPVQPRLAQHNFSPQAQPVVSAPPVLQYAPRAPPLA